jgi:signal transduction histidine kinase
MKAGVSHRIGRTPWVDVLVVAALLAASLVEIWASEDPEAGGFGGPRPVATVVAALAVVPLLLRSRRPVATAVVVLAACAAQIALAAPEQASFESFVALVLALYSVGAHAPTRASVAVLAAPVAGGVATTAVGAGPAEELLPGLVWIAAAWAFGRVVRTRDQRTRELEDLAAQLAIEREERARAAVVGERTRIARELHDVVAHNVSVIVVHAGAGARVLEGDQPIVRDALTTIETVGRQTVDEMRRLLGILRRDEELSLAPQPTLAHVDALVDHVREAGLRVELSVHGDRDGLPAGVDLAGYRIVQEALTNAPSTPTARTPGWTSITAPSSTCCGTSRAVSRTPRSPTSSSWPRRR